MTAKPFTLIDEQRPHAVQAEIRDGAARVAASTIRDVLGWKLDSRGLCRGDVCIPVSAKDGLGDEHGFPGNHVEGHHEGPVVVG